MVPTIGLSDTNHWSHRCQPLVSTVPTIGLSDTNHWSQRYQPLTSPIPTIGLNGTNNGLSDTNHRSHRYQPSVSMVPTIGLSDTNHWSQRYQQLVSTMPAIDWSQRYQSAIDLNDTEDDCSYDRVCTFLIFCWGSLQRLSLKLYISPQKKKEFSRLIESWTLLRPQSRFDNKLTPIPRNLSPKLNGLTDWPTDGLTDWLRFYIKGVTNTRPRECMDSLWVK